eukprot:COSAG06_NODE_1364_length_9696_cov_14.104929_11_plen_97_part_00
MPFYNKKIIFLPRQARDTHLESALTKRVAWRGFFLQVRANRFNNWLANANDWNIGRTRFWGTPCVKKRLFCDTISNYKLMRILPRQARDKQTQAES